MPDGETDPVENRRVTKGGKNGRLRVVAQEAFLLALPVAFFEDVALVVGLAALCQTELDRGAARVG
jgi:hypothetical protein